MLRAEDETRGPEMLRSEKLSMFGQIWARGSHACSQEALGCPDDKHSEHR